MSEIGADSETLVVAAAHLLPWGGLYVKSRGCMISNFMEMESFHSATDSRFLSWASSS